jgi:hypothetical protein
MMKIEGSGSGSISQRHGSADPDPHKNAHGSATMLSRMSDLREELEEGGGEGKVHQAAVLQGLGQEDAQAPEQAGHAPAQRGILRQRCRE